MASLPVVIFPPAPPNLGIAGLLGPAGASGPTGSAGPTGPTGPSSPLGGTSGQLQINNAGVFGGVTIGGDATLNTTTGNLVVTQTNGMAFGALATASAAAIADGALCMCTASGSANTIILTADAGFTVAGLKQTFRFYPIGTNAVGGVTITISNINSGAAAALVLASGEALPIGVFSTTTAVYIYWNTALSKYVLVSPNYVSVQGVVQCTHTNTTNGDAIVIQVLSANIRTTSGFDGTYYTFQVQATRTSAGCNIAINSWSGVSLIGATVLYEADGTTSPAVGRWSAGDTIYVRRDATSGKFLLVNVETRFATPTEGLAMTDAGHPLNAASLTLIPPSIYQAAGVMSKKLAYAVPNPTNSIVAIRVTADTWIVRMALLYGAGFSARCTDYVEYEMKDQGVFMGITSAWCLNSIRAKYKGIYVALADFDFEYKSSTGTLTDSALSPSTNEFAFALGENGQIVNATNFPLAGFSHGNMNYVGASLVDASSINHISDPVGTVVYSTTLTFGGTYNLKTGSGKIACQTTTNHLFDGPSTQLKFLHSHDFTNAVVNCVPAIWNSYSMMLATRLPNVFKTLGNAQVACAVRDGSQINYGNTGQLATWHTDYPNLILEALLAYGGPQRINGTLDSWTNCAVNSGFVLCQNYGGKFYWNNYNFAGAASANMTGNVLTCQSIYRVREATPS